MYMHPFYIKNNNKSLFISQIHFILMAFQGSSNNEGLTVFSDATDFMQFRKM